MPLDEPQEAQLKVPVVRRLYYTIFLEQATPYSTFAHCTVHVPWSRKVKQALEEDWARLRSLHGGPFFALHDPEDIKHDKFVKMFGFRQVSQFISPSDGRLYHIMKT